MRVIWEDTDISDVVLVRECVVVDTCGGRCDSLEMIFENAARWYGWGPKEDDRIIVTRDGYDSGVMYLNTILPEDGRYRVLATALPCAAREKRYRSFENRTIEDIVKACAAETGMGYALYGVDNLRAIPYIQRENESAASFLNRLMVYEGAALKCVNGRYTCIGLEWAQGRTALQTVEMRADQDGARYIRGTKIRRLDVKTPWGNGYAEDQGAAESAPGLTICLPARTQAQAARWARNKLMFLNRQKESLTIETKYDPGLTALARMDVTGGTDADGQWICDAVMHDLFNGATRARLLRCLNTIV